MTCSLCRIKLQPVYNRNSNGSQKYTDVFIIHYCMVIFVCLGMSITTKRLPRNQTHYVVDHPFVFSIISRNNIVLFLGRLVKL